MQTRGYALAFPESEPFLRLHQKLHIVDGGIAVERERQVDVDDVAEPRAAVAEPQADTHVLQQAQARRADGAFAPGSTDIEEGSGTDPNQAKRIPVREVALLHGQQRTGLASLIAKRVAAESIVAAEQDLRIQIEL